MDKSKSLDFISLFQENLKAKSKECATTDEIPTSSHQVSQKVSTLFHNYPTLRLITLSFKSKWCLKYVKAMLLQQFDDFHNISQKQQRSVMILNSIQISTDENQDAYYWVLSQIGDKCNQKDSQMMYLVSNCIIYEVTDVENDRKVFEKLSNFQGQIKRKQVTLIFIYRKANINQLQKLSLQVEGKFKKVQTICLGDEIPLSEAPPQTIQSLIQNRNTILKKVQRLGIQEININGQSLTQYFEAWHQFINPHQMNVTEFWRQFLSKQIKFFMESALQKYRLKMRQCCQDRKVNLTKMEKVNEIALEQCWLYVKQHIRVNSQIENRLIQQIRKEYENTIKVVKQTNLRLGKQYLQKQFLTIENRVKNKNIKLFENLKQQMFIFWEFIKKKSQFNQFEEFNVLFIQFILNKTVQCLSFMNEEQKIHKNRQIQTYIDKQQIIENQLKEYRKAAMKKESQYNRNYENIQQKLVYYEGREQMLEQKIQKYKKDVHNLQNSLSFKIQEKQLEHKQKLQLLNIRISELTGEIDRNRNDNMLHESQIQKEKLLHKQTINNYEMLLDKQKRREQELSYKLETVTIQSLQDVQNLKKSSIKSLEGTEVGRVQRDKEIKKMKIQLKQLSQREQIREQQFRKCKYEYDIQIQELKSNLRQMEISLKISQQQNLQYQSKFMRFNMMEEEMKKIQRLREDDLNWKKENQKNTALLQQRANFLSDSLNDQLRKYLILQKENEDLKEKMQQLSSSKQASTSVKVNEWVQTDRESKKIQQLHQALRIIDNLQAQYNKLKLQMFRQKYHP